MLYRLQGYGNAARHSLRPRRRKFERTFKTIDYGLATFDDTYSAAHGWLEEEAKGNEVEEHVRAKRLAWVRARVLGSQ